MQCRSVSYLCKSHVHSVFEFCIVVLCPYRIFFSRQVESVPRSFSRFFPEIRNLPYKDLSEKTEAFISEIDKLMFLFKIVKRLTFLDPNDFPDDPSVSKGDSQHLLQSSTIKLELCKFVFQK